MNPAARIVVLGDSVTWGQGLLPAHKFVTLVAAGMNAPSLGDEFPQTLDRGDVLGAVSARTMQFWQDSNTYMAQAVADAGGSVANAAFVQIPFVADNALFAPSPHLWGFTPDLGPEDEVAAQRGQACDLQYPSTFDLVADEICHYASVGHPNIAGAQIISRAILSTF
jgi:lysophospholipase L1-like esterase